jgi:hypothetical protein
MWRVAANILNDQPRTCDKRWCSGLKFGPGIISPSIRNRLTHSVSNVTHVPKPGRSHLKASDHLECLDVCRRIILKLILRK